MKSVVDFPTSLHWRKLLGKKEPGIAGLLHREIHSTVTDFAKFLGWSTSVPRNTATW